VDKRGLVEKIKKEGKRDVLADRGFCLFYVESKAYT
jgi:hypothetical protein